MQCRVNIAISRVVYKSHKHTKWGKKVKTKGKLLEGKAKEKGEITSSSSSSSSSSSLCGKGSQIKTKGRELRLCRSLSFASSTARLAADSAVMEFFHEEDEDEDEEEEEEEEEEEDE